MQILGRLRLSIIFSIILIISILLLFNFSACEPKERIIKIGNQSVLTGENKVWGQDQLISMSIAASEISPAKVGGFDYKVKLVTKDDEGDPEKAFLVAQEMVEQNVSAVVGSTFNGTTKVSIPIYEEYNIPAITAHAQGEDLSNIGENFFRVIMNNKQKVENIASFLESQLKPKKLILIDDRNEYSANLVDYLNEILQARNLNAFKRYSIDFSSEDLGVIVDNLIIDEPDVIFFCGGYTQLASLITKAREKDLKAKFVTEELGMDEQISVLADSKYLEGLIAVIPEPPSIAKYTENEKAISFWHKYTDFSKKMDKEDIIQNPSPYAPYCYDAVYLIINAMKNANSILPEEYIDNLSQISYDGLVGHIEFDSNGERVDPPSTAFVYTNGAWARY
ncbi:MAG: branched-chain amino acid ABC transporter substrate-binding protein [Candidatus Humimicrobiaceae bacterium]